MSDKSKTKFKESNTLVVGLGASAGGLDPLKEFFKSLPDKTGMAFIVVLHLSPDKESNLSEVLQRETNLEVLQVEEKTAIESDHVYVIPPNKLLAVEDDHLGLSELKEKHSMASIDHLFQTLAGKKKKYAAGVILSGTGSDGVTGIKAIKEEGGITIAQDPKEAGHSGMPNSAIQTGLVDKVLPVKDIAGELIEYRKILSEINISEKAEELSEEEETEKILNKIFDLLRSNTDHDFSNYRRSSVLRRIDRRMRLNRTKSLSEYLEFLKKNSDEVKELRKDLLISVTNFFRDKEAYEALEKKVIPKLFEDIEDGRQIRIWIPGCATGEEAYSLAILLREHALKQDNPPEIKIFATDVDKNALDVGRSGRYPKSIKKDISSERLNRFFTKEEDKYLIKRELRDMILFAPHDLLRNPPFSKLDLISCRNLLIYLNKDLQTEVFNLFHYALRNEGWLFLGKSDSRSGTTDYFKAVDKQYRIYQQEAHLNGQNSLPKMPLMYRAGTVKLNQKNSSQDPDNFEKMHWSILAQLYAPESVLISKNYEVFHSTANISKYLQYSGGEPSSNILNMVKPEIRQSLRSMLFQLKNKEDLTPVRKRIQIDEDDSSKKIDLIARHFSEKEYPNGLIQVVFKEVPADTEKSETKSTSTDTDTDSTKEASEIIESLEKELEYTKEQLQLTAEEYETSNEELRASNEELQSMNEELQSATEELETSKEELQSVNEELKTVNDQLEDKVQQLSQAHSDLENLIEATEIGIIFVDKEMCIRRFTNTTKEIFNLIKTDKGRPLQHITHSLDYDSLLEDIENVLNNLDRIKKTVHTKDGRWYIMRMRPYLTSEDEMNGVVLSFAEFTELKKAREIIKEQNYQETLATLGVYALEKDDLDMIMHRAIQQSCAILNLKTSAVIALNENKTTFEVASDAGCDCKGIEIANEETWDMGFAFGAGEPVTVQDYSKEKRFKISPFLTDKKIKSSALIAIRGTDEIFGVFAVYSKEKKEFLKEDINFIQVVSNILGRSIEKKRAEKELKRTNELLEKEVERSEQLQRELLSNNVLQRWELGSYLHDNFGQLLASIKILVDDIEIKISDNDINITSEAEEIKDIIDRSIEDVRNLIHEIIPVDIEKEGVRQAFRLLMNQTSRLHGVKCILENNEMLNQINNRTVATHLYHILQEAINNAAIHGNADTVVVSVEKTDDIFVMKIKDDGLGLSESRNETGKGLRIMKHRMDLLGGTFNVQEYSDKDKSGTVITCSLPVAKIKRDEELE